MKIGIFGGCFNPPHNMHKNIPLQLINKHYLDRVIYVPTGNDYQKKDLIDINKRIDMLSILIKDKENLEISSIMNNKDYQYTYQVMDYFKKIYKEDEIYFICGTDNLKEFNKWKEYKYILNNYKLLVIRRNDDNIKELLKKYKSNNIVITNIKKQIISSTLIRDYLRKDDKELDNYLNKDIINYIKKNNLYY